MRILVVEDERDVRTLIRFHLEQEGYAVREAETRIEASRVRVRREAALPAVIGWATVAVARARSAWRFAAFPVLWLAAEHVRVLDHGATLRRGLIHPETRRRARS